MGAYMVPVAGGHFGCLRTAQKSQREGDSNGSDWVAWNGEEDVWDVDRHDCFSILALVFDSCTKIGVTSFITCLFLLTWGTNYHFVLEKVLKFM